MKKTLGRALAAPPSTQPRCSTCSLRKLCLPCGLNAAEIDRLDEIAVDRLGVRKGDVLFHAGDKFGSVFAVRAGSFKTTLPGPAGEAQITGLQMAGDLLGLTGMAEGVQACDSIALEDAHLCAIDFAQLESLARECPALQHGIHRYMSRALVADQVMLKLLAQARSDERVAKFLLHLAQRQEALGLPSDDLLLRVSREEIGNLLGLRIETVSRCLSRLQDEGTLEIRGRRIRVLRQDQLRLVAQGSPDSAASP